jgi:predicted DNA-binding transcriptional regulator AlpA
LDNPTCVFCFFYTGQILARYYFIGFEIGKEQEGMIFISVTEKVLVDKRLLNIDEVCAYLGIGQTKAREILTKTDNPFTVRLGNRLYANKILLDKWIDSISGNRIRKVI